MQYVGTIETDQIPKCCGNTLHAITSILEINNTNLESKLVLACATCGRCYISVPHYDLRFREQEYFIFPFITYTELQDVIFRSFIPNEHINKVSNEILYSYPQTEIAIKIDNLKMELSDAISSLDFEIDRLKSDIEEKLNNYHNDLLSDIKERIYNFQLQ